MIFSHCQFSVLVESGIGKHYAQRAESAEALINLLHASLVHLHLFYAIALRVVEEVGLQGGGSFIFYNLLDTYQPSILVIRVGRLSILSIFHFVGLH